MTDYSEIPNAFINSQVAHSQGLKLWPHTVFMPITDERVRLEDGSYFDPCNNPSDAWPIILANKICINNFCKFGWCSDSELGDYVYHENPLRAAMIVYLMMKESDSAQG